MITSMDHVRELSDAPQLSQRAVYADIFGFQYNMNHMSTSLDPNEQVPHRYRLFSTAIRSIGVSQLRDWYPHLQVKANETTTIMLDLQPKDSEGWHTVTLAQLTRNLASGLLGIYFFGNSLYSEDKFREATFDFYFDVIRCMGALQIIPSFAKKTVHNFLTHNRRALRMLFSRLSYAIKDDKDGWKEDENLKPLTLLYHLKNQTQNSDYWTTDLLIQAILGIWFAASHQPWINLHFVMLELCERPKYVQKLREEIGAQPSLDVEAISKLRLLDSFIKECVRLNPLDRSKLVQISSPMPRF